MNLDCQINHQVLQKNPATMSETAMEKATTDHWHPGPWAMISKRYAPGRNESFQTILDFFF